MVLAVVVGDTPSELRSRWPCIRALFQRPQPQRPTVK